MKNELAFMAVGGQRGLVAEVACRTAGAHAGNRGIARRTLPVQ